MNPVIVLTRNNIALTKRCVQSLDQQDIPNTPYLFDNGSTDGTWQWMQDTFGFMGTHSSKNHGVTRGWNFCLRTFFDGANEWRSDHVLCVGNDTWLAPWFYRTLLETVKSRNISFITGVAVNSMDQAMQTPDVDPITDNPDFSAFLITRECWEQVGPFDDGMVHYSSDQDFHIRAHRQGVRLCKASVPYFHERSSTIRLASPEERLEIEAQANKDREYLRQKWGVSAGGPDYEALFRPETFGCDSGKIGASVFQHR